MFELEETSEKVHNNNISVQLIDSNTERLIDKTIANTQKSLCTALSILFDYCFSVHSVIPYVDYLAIFLAQSFAVVAIYLLAVI